MISRFGKNIGFALGSNVLNIRNICKKKYGNKKTLEILSKTGPKKIFQCTRSEDSLSISIKAWKNFQKKNKNFSKKKVKNLIFVTETNKLTFPGNGFLFASKINLDENIKILDLNSGCTGFVDAMKVANKLSGNSLIVCSETYSKSIPNFVRSLTTLFSDGGSIFFFEKEKLKILKEISYFKKNSYLNLSNYKGNISMDGKKVFDFVLTKVFPKIENFIKNNSRIRTIFVHQASKIVCNFFINKFKDYNIEIPTNLSTRGNTVSATIPILINDYSKKNNFKINDKILLVGFGVGLSMSAILLKIKK